MSKRLEHILACKKHTLAFYDVDLIQKRKETEAIRETVKELRTEARKEGYFFKLNF